ncbi:MAG TPA: hypothetical protein VHU89_11140 [Acidobacteriaceae bacterium]|jgi:hypothetical protein|nr:hypothetical protein [Acidobacteriaceae bacterium]
MSRSALALLSLFLLFRGCSSQPTTQTPPRHWATGAQPELLAVYEPWFGHPAHISVGYSSHDPAEVKKQVDEAKSMGISGFVVDWYGDRDPFNDITYALVQKTAGEENFHVAMMYDESNAQVGATDEALADFRMFHDKYLAADAAGRDAYLTYDGRPVIFIFPKGRHTDWDRVREDLNQWNPRPFLIEENLPGAYAKDFDGFYAWVNPGSGGWKLNGSDWGKDYLEDFYQTMRTKYPDKMPVGGAWPGFDDSKASWSLDRHMDFRCGKTFADTFNLGKKYFPPDNPLQYLLIETWNDYEEGTAIERGIPSCGSGGMQPALPLR